MWSSPLTQGIKIGLLGYGGLLRLSQGSHTHSVLWQARDPGGGEDFFGVLVSSATPIRQGISEVCNIATGYAFECFSKVYCDRVYFSCAERIMTGSGFAPPPPPRRHPLSSWEVECPPPPPPPGTSHAWIHIICFVFSVSMLKCSSWTWKNWDCASRRDASWAVGKEEHRVNYHHGYCFKYLPRMLEEFQAKVEDINDGQRQG